MKLSASEGTHQHGSPGGAPLFLDDEYAEIYMGRIEHSPLTKTENLIPNPLQLSKATQMPLWQLNSLQAALIKAFCKRSSIGDLSS
eukprot:698524-Karenia_brevis.AAC.1